MHQCFRLQGAATDASDARRHVEQLCEGLAVEVIETATLLTSEAVTNAFEHGEGPITLDLVRSSDGVRVEVTDESPARPEVAGADLEAVEGRGMLLIEQHARAWGVRSGTSGTAKTVWFTLGNDVDELRDL
jgi:anti-sigma regulatory factor (Ser/Thr protein kinase)